MSRRDLAVLAALTSGSGLASLPRAQTSSPRIPAAEWLPRALAAEQDAEAFEQQLRADGYDGAARRLAEQRRDLARSLSLHPEHPAKGRA